MYKASTTVIYIYKTLELLGIHIYTGILISSRTQITDWGLYHNEHPKEFRTLPQGLHQDIYVANSALSAHMTPQNLDNNSQYHRL
jgi:hypothetical protein